MKIQTIRYADQEHSTLIVNDTMSVPWPCHTWHDELIQEWLDAGNAIAPYTKWNTLADAIVGRIEEINAECRRRILAKWPLEKQQSCSLGVYPPAIAQQCADDIAAMIAASNLISDVIEGAQDINEVEAVQISWPII